MTRPQQIKLITSQLETLDSEALEGLIKLLKHKSVIVKRTPHNKAITIIDKESQVWLSAELTPPLPPYEWGDNDPSTLGEPLRYIKGKGWVNE